MIKTFRKKPIEIQAVQWTGDNYDEILNFTGELNVEYSAEYWNKLIIHTLEGNHYVSLGDWIIRGVAGEFYPCKPGIFKHTYEEVVK